MADFPQPGHRNPVSVPEWPIFRCPDTADPVSVPEWPISRCPDTTTHVSVPDGPVSRCPDTTTHVSVPEWPISRCLDTADPVSVPGGEKLEGQVELEAQGGGRRGGALPGAGGAEADFAAEAGRAGRLSLETGAE